MTKLQSPLTAVSGSGAANHDHHWLQAAIDETCASLRSSSPRPSISDALGVLYVRSCAHFALEETMLRERGPEVYAAHKARDEMLLERMRTMMDAFDDGACDACDKSLAECLSDWLDDHLAGTPPPLRALDG